MIFTLRHCHLEINLSNESNFLFFPQYVCFKLYSVFNFAFFIGKWKYPGCQKIAGDNPAIPWKPVFPTWQSKRQNWRHFRNSWQHWDMIIKATSRNIEVRSQQQFVAKPIRFQFEFLPHSWSLLLSPFPFLSQSQFLLASVLFLDLISPIQHHQLDCYWNLKEIELVSLDKETEEMSKNWDWDRNIFETIVETMFETENL